MTSEPGDPNRPDDPGKGSNPFAGTPFESLFGQLGGLMGAGGSGVPDLGALLGQFRALMSPSEGPVNWDLARQTAQQVVAGDKDPAVTAKDRDAVSDAVRLAEHWLDTATDLPQGATSAEAWRRQEWLERTAPVWRELVEPVATHVVEAMGKTIPADARQMMGPLIGMLTQAGGAMFGSQVGQALGAMSSEVVSGYDIGLPLGPADRVVLLPANVKEFGEGLGLKLEDVTLYLALRESAHQRLFTHAPWLRSRLLDAVAEYARGIDVDTSRIEEAMRSFDPTNMGQIQEALSSGMFEPEQTPRQKAALTRLETLLALIEGWVDEVVSQATDSRMPEAGRLREAVRRRRAAGGPAEQTFVSLVGLELRPRRLRDAATLWGALRSAHGAGERDAVWSHPDLLPTAEDLDDPLGFADRRKDDDFDIGDLLDDDPEQGKPKPDDPGKE